MPIQAPLSMLSMLSLLLLAALPPAARAEEPRGEIGLQIAPGGLSNDGRRLRAISYDRDVRGGWWVGGSLGYGNVMSGDGSDGLYGVVRLRYRAEPLRGASWLQPQVGIEYGGTTDLFDSVDLLSAFVGGYVPLSSELGLTLDLSVGHARFDNEGLLGNDVKRSGTVTNVRFGIAFRF